MTISLYRQCLLRKRIDDVTTQTQVTWLPNRYAVQGRILKLRNPDGIWVDGWVVKVAGADSVPESRLPDAHAAIRSHRSRTGDSQPRIGNA